MAAARFRGGQLAKDFTAFLISCLHAALRCEGQCRRAIALAQALLASGGGQTPPRDVDRFTQAVFGKNSASGARKSRAVRSRRKRPRRNLVCVPQPPYPLLGTFETSASPNNSSPNLPPHCLHSYYFLCGIKVGLSGLWACGNQSSLTELQK